MAKRSSKIGVFSNTDGYRFVDDQGVTTAVLEASGKFSLREGNSSLEVHESYVDFMKIMGETPKSTVDEKVILDQLSNMGLGRCEYINLEPKNTKSPEHEESPMATATKDKTIEQKKKDLEKIKAERKAKTAKPAAKAAKTATPKELGDCQCGCGEKVARNFKQGHDARTHGWGKKIDRGEMKFSEIPSPNPAIPEKYLKAHGTKYASQKSA